MVSQSNPGGEHHGAVPPAVPDQGGREEEGLTRPVRDGDGAPHPPGAGSSTEFIGGHPVHAVALMQPPLPPEIYERLRDDIRENSQLVPIVRVEGQICDGVHRLRACLELDIEPVFQDLDDSRDPLDVVLSLGVIRRDLSENGRAYLAHNLSARSKPGRRTVRAGKQANLPGFLSIPEAAKLVGVSERTVRHARRVHSTDSPAAGELRSATMEGRISYSDASRVVDHPPEVQRRAVDLVLGSRAKTVRTAVRMVEEELAAAEGAGAELLSLPMDDSFSVWPCTIAGLHQHVEPGSVDLIACFPPTDARDIPLFSEIAAFAAHALSPDGLMALTA